MELAILVQQIVEVAFLLQEVTAQVVLLASIGFLILLLDVWPVELTVPPAIQWDQEAVMELLIV
jgi:hypothetical protein